MSFPLDDSSQVVPATVEQLVQLGDYLLQGPFGHTPIRPPDQGGGCRNEPQLDQAGSGVPRIGTVGSDGAQAAAGAHLPSGSGSSFESWSPPAFAAERAEGARAGWERAAARAAER